MDYGFDFTIQTASTSRFQRHRLHDFMMGQTWGKQTQTTRFRRPVNRGARILDLTGDLQEQQPNATDKDPHVLDVR